MAQEKCEYERMQDYIDLAKKVVDRYPDRFNYIDLDRVRAYCITNKERKDSQLPYIVQPVKYPLLIDSPFSHYVVIYDSDWSLMNEKHKLLLVARTLCAISHDEDTNEMMLEKVNSPDMKDFSPMLRTFGTDYLIRDDVPHLLEEEVKWND